MNIKSFFDKYSTWVGIGLIIIALVGGVFLMVKKGASADVPKVDDRDKQISDLQAQVATLQKENQTLKNQSSTSQSSNQTQSVVSSQPVGKININTATAAQLDSLPAIGPTIAQKIINYRNSHGPFKSIEELTKIKVGIGAKTFAKFKDLITI